MNLLINERLAYLTETVQYFINRILRMIIII